LSGFSKRSVKYALRALEKKELAVYMPVLGDTRKKLFFAVQK